MASTKSQKVLICSVDRLIGKSKITNQLNLYTLNKYRGLVKQLDNVRNISRREDIFKQIQACLTDLQYGSSDITTSVMARLPDFPYRTDSNGDPQPVTGGGNTNTPIVTAVNLTIPNSSLIQETLFGSGDPVDTYILDVSDFLTAYSDNNDGTFYGIAIETNDLDGLGIKFSTSSTTGQLLGENNSQLQIQRDSFPQWALYVLPTTTTFTHTLTYSFIDLVNSQFIFSNTAQLTIDRTLSANQPATLGDNTIIVGNRAVTTLTLAMFTTQLSPPYNDPENDLIDAIRLDEISTANQGVFRVNGINVVEGQIITRETIDAGQFTHEAPNVDSISSDVFSFSARDEGSQIWVT